MSLSKADSRTPQTADPSRTGRDVSGVGGVSMPQLGRLSGMADGGADATRVRDLSAMADASSQVGSLQGMADRVMGAAPASFSFEQELQQMEGQLTQGAKFNKFLGKESTYSKLIGVVKEYVQARKPEAKEALKPKVLASCREWVGKHGASKDPGDLQKKASIERIRGALEAPARPAAKPPAPPAPAPTPAPAPGPVPEAPKPVAPVVAPVVEPVPVADVAPDSLTPFERIREAFEAYQGMTGGPLEGAGALYEACRKLYEVRTGITGWMRDFGRSPDGADVERRGKLFLMEVALGALEADVDVPPYFQAHVTGLNVNALARGVFQVRSMDVTLDTAYGKASGQLSQVTVLPTQFSFEHLSLALDGAIEVMSGFTISAPSIEVSTAGGGYQVTAGGEVSIERPAVPGLGSFSVQGSVQAGFDFGTKRVQDPLVEGATLRATLFDALDIRVDALDYAEGRLTASTGSLTIRALEKSVTTTVTDIAYSARDGITFQDVEVASSDTYEPVPGFTVEQPTLKLSKTAAGWDLEGSGTLGVSFGDQNFRVDKLAADVTLHYGIGTGGLQAFDVSQGSLDMTVFQSLRLEVPAFTYADGALQATAATLSLTLLGRTLTGTATDLAYDATQGLTLKDATITSPGTYEPVPGIAIQDPVLTLQREPSGWKVGGEGALELRAGLGDLVRLERAAGQVKLLYDVKGRALEEAAVDQGAIDLTLFDVVQVEGSGISFDRTTGELTVGSGKVRVGVPADAFGGATLEGQATNLRVGRGVLDWDSIGVDIGGEVRMGDFVFQPPSGFITREGDSFIVGIRDAAGAFQLGKLLNVDGSVSLQWSPEAGLKVTEGALHAATEEIDAFQTFIPFFAQGLSFSTGFTVPFLAGPVPMQAGFEVGGEVGAKMKLDLDMAYADDTFAAAGNVKLEPTLGMYIKLSVGMGSEVIAYIGGYIKGQLDAKGTGQAGFQAEAVQQADGKYKMNEFLINYGIAADLKATLKGGAEFKALYFIKKELYEVDIRSWDLGKAEMKGRYALVSGTNLEDKRSNVFQGMGQQGASWEALGIRRPDNILQHRAYREALEGLVAAMDQVRLSAEDDKDGTADILVQRHKKKLSANFERMIERFDARFAELQEKRDRNRLRIDTFRQTHAEWLQRQQEKLAEATRLNTSRGLGWSLVPWPHWKNTQWYTKKIAQGGHKYDTRLQGKQQRLNRIAEELGVFQQELSHTRSILAQLDTLLRPGGSLVLDGIIGSVESNKSALEEAGRKGGQAPELEAGQGTGEIFAFEDSEVVRD